MLAVAPIAHTTLFKLVMAELMRRFECAVIDEGISLLERVKTNYIQPKKSNHTV